MGNSQETNTFLKFHPKRIVFLSHEIYVPSIPEKKHAVSLNFQKTQHFSVTTPYPDLAAPPQQLSHNNLGGGHNLVQNIAFRLFWWFGYVLSI